MRSLCMSDHRCRLPGSSSNRQRGCEVALLEEYRSREVPKLVLLEERAMKLLLLLHSIITQLCNICQIHKKSNMLIEGINSSQ